MEEFVDFTVGASARAPRRRPTSARSAGPITSSSRSAPRRARFDLVVGLGVEPHLRWRAFSAAGRRARAPGRRAAGDPARRVPRRGDLLAADPGRGHEQRPGSRARARAARRRATRDRPESSACSATRCSRPAFPTLSLWARLPHYVQADAELARRARAAAARRGDHRLPVRQGRARDRRRDLRPGSLRSDRRRPAALRLRPRAEEESLLAVSSTEGRCAKPPSRRDASGEAARSEPKASEVNRSELLEDSARRGRAVERVEVQPRRAAPEQLAALRGGPLDADLERALVVRRRRRRARGRARRECARRTAWSCAGSRRC